jgi:protocatechuate 3,4-dioxygenase beta subunit
MPRHRTYLAARAPGGPSLLLLLFFAAAAPAFGQGAPAAWTGRVIDADNKPVAGARVVLCCAAGEEPDLFKVETETVTDETGQFLFRGIGPRDESGFDRLIFAHKEGFAWGAPPVSNAPGKSDEPVKIVLSKPAALSGRVVDGRGNPVEGARIGPMSVTEAATGGAVHWEAPRGLPFLSAVSGPDGAFTLSDLPEKYTATLQVTSPPGFADYRERVRPGREDRTAPAEGIEIKLQAEAVVRGKLLHEVTGVPAAGIPLVAARIQGGTWACRTDDEGAFEFRRLASGGYRFGLWAGSWFDGTVVPMESLPVDEGQTLDLDLRWNEGIEVTVRTWSGAEGQPAEGCFVEAEEARSGLSRLTRSDAEGTARLRLPPGRHRVTVTNPDGVGETLTIQVAEDMPPIEEAFVLPGPEPVVLVNVTDDDGRPVRDAVVAVEGEKSAVCDAGGNAQVKGRLSQAAKPLFMLVNDPLGRLAGAFELPMESGESVDAVIGPAASISGRVEDEEGRPLPDAAVSVTLGRPGPEEKDLFHPAKSVRTDADGRFAIGGLPSGEVYEVTATRDGYGAARRRNDVETLLEPGADWDVGTLVPPAANRRLEGMIRWADGRPIIRAMLNVWSGSADARQAASDQAGRFAFDGLVPEEVQLTVNVAGHYVYRNVPPETFGDVRIVIFPGYSAAKALGAGTEPPELTGVEWIAGAPPEPGALRGIRRIVAFVSIRNPAARRLMARLNDLPRGWVAVCVHDAGASADEVRAYLEANGLRLNLARVTAPEYEGRYSDVFNDYKVQSLPFITVIGPEGAVECPSLQLEELEALLKEE